MHWNTLKVKSRAWKTHWCLGALLLPHSTTNTGVSSSLLEGPSVSYVTRLMPSNPSQTSYLWVFFMPLLCSLVGLLATSCSWGQNVLLGEEVHQLTEKRSWGHFEASWFGFSLQHRWKPEMIFLNPERAFHALVGLLTAPHVSRPLSEAGIADPTWTVHDPVLPVSDSISQEQLLLPFVARY